MALTDNAWKELGQDKYLDNATVWIFEKTLPTGERVQISLRRDLSEFMALWESIPRDLYWEKINKRSPQHWGKDQTREYLDLLARTITKEAVKTARQRIIDDYN